ncbi:hypothetical protein niasHS_017169 [Heterodera schachtii]|uniref:Homeobox domain-containing protein n=1 Tax=Heterodera schachtii TaxID=97005 RepID=A0ABD2I3J7_HETSC
MEKAVGESVLKLSDFSDTNFSFLLLLAEGPTATVICLKMSSGNSKRKFFVEELLELDNKVPKNESAIILQRSQQQNQIRILQNSAPNFGHMFQSLFRTFANRNNKFYRAQMCQYQMPMFLQWYCPNVPTLPYHSNGVSDVKENTVATVPKGRKRKRRQAFSAEQIHFLEDQFQSQRYISSEQRAKISLQLGLSQQQVKIWFQNRRYKQKMMGKEMNEMSEK